MPNPDEGEEQNLSPSPNPSENPSYINQESDESED